MSLCRVIVYKDDVLNLLTFFKHRKESKETGQDEESVKLNIKRKMRLEVKRKQLPQEDEGITNLFHPKEHPADGYYQKSDDCTWPFPYFSINIE